MCATPRLRSASTVLFLTTCAYGQPDWFPISDWPNQINAVSADGRVTAGYENYQSRGIFGVAYVISEHLGYFVEGPNDSSGSRVLAMSPDGSVLGGEVAFLSGTPRTPASLWTLRDRLAHVELLGDLPGGSESAVIQGASLGGAVLVGRGRDALGVQAIRWTREAGLTPLGDLAGGANWSEATGISADGTLTVGFASREAGLVACVWNGSIGPTPLHDPGPSRGSVGLGVSADGSTIVGAYTTPTGVYVEAAAWDRWGQEMRIPHLPDQTLSVLLCANADGRLAGGYSKLALDTGYSRNHALLWNPWRGSRLLAEVLEGDMGVELGDFRPAVVTAISADGTVVVGYGAIGNRDDSTFPNRRGFIARIPRFCLADIDDSGAVDGQDVQVFFSLWEAAADVADLNLSGGVDGADVETFFLAWAQGC